MKTTGRYAESPRELLIEIVGNTSLSDPSGYEYRMLGTGDRRTENKDKVFAVLTDEPQDIEMLARKAGLGEKAARTAAEELCKEGKAIREGKGVKNDPHTYRLHCDATEDHDADSDSNSDSFRGSTKPPFEKETNWTEDIPEEWREPIDWDAIRRAEQDLKKSKGRFH